MTGGGGHSLTVETVQKSVACPGLALKGTGEQTQRAGEQTQRAGEQTQRAGEQTQRAGEQTQRAGAQTQGAGEQTQRAGAQTQLAGAQTQRINSHHPEKKTGLQLCEQDKFPASFNWVYPIKH